MTPIHLIILSARTGERLLAYAKALVHALRQQRYTDAQLPGIAWTLQTGREPMDERLAFTAATISDMISQLDDYIEGGDGQYLTGQAAAYKETLSSFLQEQELVTMTKVWIQGQQYERILSAWVKGCPIDWEALYITATGETRYPQRVSLPTYPFDKKRYWISEQHTQAYTPPQPVVAIPEQPTARLPKTAEPYQLLTFEEQWREQARTPVDKNIRLLLCLVSNRDHQQQLAATLQKISPATRIVFVSQEVTHSLTASNEYHVPQQADTATFQQMLHRIQQDHGPIDAIFYGWALEQPVLLLDHYTIVSILQAIQAGGWTIPQLLLVAQWPTQNKAHQLDRCYAESWAGFERSLGLVIPGLQLKSVYEESNNAIDIPTWTSRCWEELNGADKRSALYRAGKRYALQVQPITLPPTHNILRPGGNYLITGGLGSLGQVVARHLATRYAARLILTGRSAPDTKKQEQLAALQQLGAQVYYLQADVTDAAAMRAGLQAAIAQLGPIDGFIHAAGNMDTQLLPGKTPQAFQQVLDPKVNGTILLDELLKDQPLAFTCYFTSASAILGDFGACDYAIANRFQVSFAQSRHRLMLDGLRQGKTIAINWPLWKEGSMDLDDAENTKLYLKSSGQRYLESDEGMELFEQLIAQPATQLLVVAAQASKANRFLGITAPATPPSPPTVVNPLPQQPTQVTTIPNTGPANNRKTEDALLRDLTTLVSKAQQIPESDLLPDDNLADIGFDSISLTELARLLSQQYNTTIAPAIFFGYSTIRKLQEYFLKEHKALIEAKYAAANPATATPPAAPPVATPPLPIATATVPLEPAQAISPRAANRQEPIAIIGMSGRFPAARNTTELWQLLAEGKEAVTEIPASRFDWRTIYSAGETTPGKTNCKWSGLIPGIAEFDPAFFGISPKEAATMDPRQRLLLQEAWNALEDAAYGPTQIAKERIGLFVGAEESGFTAPANEAGLTASHNAILAARLSYFMNLKGPNMAINTACSSGLVAAHQAFQSLQTGECDTAIAAAVNLMQAPELYIGMSQAGMLSGDGKCLAFDERANGMVPAEAVVAVVLKRYADALADGDPIYATIQASGINYDGKTNGITAPNALAQTDLLQTIYQRFAIDPAQIDYVVTHGTGTRLGDPVEVNALHDAFKAHTPKKGYCALTSAKSNLGHSFAASGLVNMVNLVQAFTHETIPATLHCQQESDYIDWGQTAFYINKTAKPWPAIANRERLGAISAFGMSGTNAHMVLQSHTPVVATATEALPCLLVLSAKTPEALQAKAAALALEYAQGTLQAARLIDIAYTLLAGRQHFKYRTACIVRTKAEAVTALQQLADKKKTNVPFAGEVARDFKERAVTLQFIATLAAQPAGEEANSLEENLAALADLYCQGYELPAQLLASRTGRRIHLPGYPFSREEYGVQSTNHTIVQQSPIIEVPDDQPGMAQPEATAILTFEETWQETALPVNDRLTTGDRLLCFCSNPAHQKLISEQLVSTGYAQQVIYVVAGTQPEAGVTSEGSHWYSVDAKDEASYQQLFHHIVQAHGQPHTLLYAWSFEQAPGAEDHYPLFAIVRAVYAAKLALQQIIVSAYWSSPAGPDSVVAQSWIGWERTAPIVLPHTTLRCVYFETGATTDPLQECIGYLGQELRTTGKTTVLYRNSQRYTATIREITPAPATAPVLKPGGVYLITGGAGGIGSIIAGHLAHTYQAKLVLTGRSAPGAVTQTMISQWEQAGASVTYYQADVCSETDMDTVLTATRERFGRIDGVIHAAGIAGNKSIYNQDYIEFRQVLQPKVQGTILLDRLLAHEPLDFMVYLSSGTAIAGDFGSCNYAIANRFQMGYATYRQALQQTGQRQGKTLVINWPLWKDGGMHLQEEALTQQFLRTTGQQLLGKAAGIDQFEQLLRQPVTQAMVMTGNPVRLRQLFGLTAQSPATPQPAAEAGIAAPFLRTTAMQQLDTEQCLLHDLKDQVNQLLGIAVTNIDSYENLVDMGFDSIRLTQLAKALTAHFQLDLLPSLFFGYPTLDRLTQYLYSEHGAYLEKAYRNNNNHTAQKIPAAPPAPVSDQPTPIAAPLPPVSYKPAHTPAPTATPEPIAIIGMSGRFPKARNIDELWQLLLAGTNAVEEIPPSRFDWRQYYDGQEQPAPGKTNCKWTGIVPGIDEFDPLFFEIPPIQAAAIDPRQRLLLQEAYKALEDAGYGAEQIRHNKIGMYVGAEESSYASSEGNLTSNNNAILAARLSYFLDLSGPNMAINTACSSGLVAVHQACLSLRQFECDTAIAAAVNLLYTPEPYVAMSQAGMLSPDGQCHSFDKNANGMVPGEAVAAIVLKRLSKAQADGDPIYATIIGSGLNYDGRTNGITAPSGVAQTTLLKSVYQQYQVDPASIGHIVTHGTGTKLGDAIEITALQDAFKQPAGQQAAVALTSTKSNLGHTLAASGLVSLISLVQSLRYQTIPASLHCSQENDHINWNNAPFYVNKQHKPWPAAPGKTLTGAVSAFGMSGTNAHMVLQRYTPAMTAPITDPPPACLLVLSAKTPAALQEKISDLLQWMQQGTGTHQLADIAYTLLAGRHHYRYRATVLATSIPAAVNSLQQLLQQQQAPHLLQGEVSNSFSRQPAIKQQLRQCVEQIVAAQAAARDHSDLLAHLAQYYVQGYDLPADELFSHYHPCRIHLPTYPFAKEKYWVTQAAAVVQPAVVIPPVRQPEQPEKPASSNGHGKTHQYLKQLLSSVTGLSTDMIEEDTPFTSYGIDSILTLQLKNRLEVVAGELPADLFFAHPTIRTLATYFVTTHPGILTAVSHPQVNTAGPEEDLLKVLTHDAPVMQEYLKEIVSELLGIATIHLDATQRLEYYGVDSILLVQLKNRLRKALGELPVSLFYEYPTIRDLAGYFCETTANFPLMITEEQHN